MIYWGITFRRRGVKEAGTAMVKLNKDVVSVADQLRLIYKEFWSMNISQIFSYLQAKGLWAAFFNTPTPSRGITSKVKQLPLV